MQWMNGLGRNVWFTVPRWSRGEGVLERWNVLKKFLYNLWLWGKYLVLLILFVVLMKRYKMHKNFPFFFWQNFSLRDTWDIVPKGEQGFCIFDNFQYFVREGHVPNTRLITNILMNVVGRSTSSLFYTLVW